MYATTVGIKYLIIRTQPTLTRDLIFTALLKIIRCVCLFVFLLSDDKLRNNIRKDVRENGTSTIKSRGDSIGFFISVA